MSPKWFSEATAEKKTLPEHLFEHNIIVYVPLNAKELPLFRRGLSLYSYSWTIMESLQLLD